MKQILGLQVNSIENVLLSCAIFFLVLYIISLVIEKKPTWFLSKTLRQTYELQDRFQKLVGSRRDILHHYYWARSESDSKKMKQMDKDLTRVDNEIQQVREDYKKKKVNLTTIVQKLF